MKFKIDPELLQISMRKAQEIFNMSSKLRNYDTKVIYHERRPSFVPLVSETGFTEFYPKVTVNVLPTFLELFKPEILRLFNRYLQSETEDEAQYYKNLLTMADLFTRHLTNEDIIYRRIPIKITEFIKEKGLKGFNSPKLSKILSKLTSEKSKFWAWFTNKCPREISFGENKEYKIVLSVLPHHIAGMSYYSCYNFCGKRWNGWEGTSCQDPYRNSTGSTIFHLPASLKDETLAIAYLTKAENDDIMNPIYEARALIRVVELSNGNVFYIVLKQYGYPESVTILIDGLKNQFKNVFINEEIREYKDSKILRIYMDIKDCRHIVSETCGECGGEGIYEDGDVCWICGGSGISDEEVYLPYNDDTDIWQIDDETGEKIMYRVPKNLLIENGLYEDKKEQEKEDSIPLEV